MPKRARAHEPLPRRRERKRHKQESKPKSFLDFPRELRDMIYDYALPPATYYDRKRFIDESKAYDFDFDKPDRPLRAPTYLYPVVTNEGLDKLTLPSLFLVCRSVSQEAMRIHYNKALICLDSGFEQYTEQAGDGYIRWEDELVVTNPRSFRGKTWPRHPAERRQWKLGLAVTRAKNLHFSRQSDYDPMRFLDTIRATLAISAKVNPDFARTQITTLHLADILDPYYWYELEGYPVGELDLNSKLNHFWKSLHELATVYPICGKLGIRNHLSWRRPALSLDVELLDSYGFEPVWTSEEVETEEYFWPQAGDDFRDWSEPEPVEFITCYPPSWP